MTSRSAKRRIRSAYSCASSAVGPCPSPPRAGGSSLHLDTRSVGPEAFEVVVRPVVGVEHVHHHVPEIEQDPASSALSLAARSRRPLRRSAPFSTLSTMASSCRSLPPLPDHQEVGVPGHPPAGRAHHALGLLLLGGAGSRDGGALRILIDAGGRARSLRLGPACCWDKAICVGSGIPCSDGSATASLRHIARYVTRHHRSDRAPARLRRQSARSRILHEEDAACVTH